MKCLRKWGLPLLTGAVVLGTVLLPRQISALRDRQILGTVHMEPMTAEELGTLIDELDRLCAKFPERT